ncbi:MAG: hypothetical protein DRI86_07335 [Bacteroidetes bacterium]|nr:MAG: hypothetical protein DRI86_07335 [Bacteroidota bacterium]
MKKKLMIIMLASVLGFVLYLTLFNMSMASVIVPQKIPYSKDGFVDAMTLSDKNYLVADNGILQLYLDETTSYFKVVNKDTGVEWNSNPTGPDPWQLDLSKTITNSAIEKQKSTLELSYFNETGSLAKINNYTMSIHHPKSVLFDDGLRTYSIKYIQDGFQVLYDIKDVDIDYLYFPKYLKPEILEAHPQKDLLQAIAYTGYDEDLGVYVINQYEDMSVLVRSRLYDIFYGPGSLGYTRERAIEENAEYGYTDVYEPVSFKIALEVKLTPTGVKTSVIQDSISETENAKLATVSLYPLFGTAISEVGGVATNGYIVVPDGSGAVIEFNNGKYYQQPYAKRLYGEDLGILEHKMPEVQQKISIPLYGMVKEDGAFAAIITNGDTMATLNADVSERIDSYNKVYPTFNFRENEAVTLGTGYNQYALDLWTEDRVDTDFTVEYTFLDKEEADYVHIAKAYRTYLEDNFGFDSVDNTRDTLCTIEFLGAYESKSFFLGVPYYRTKSLTTFSESQIILKELATGGVKNVNVIYKGMINGGMSSSIANDFDIERVLGGNKGYSSLLDYARENNIEIYPSIRLLATNDFNKMFDNYRYSSKRIDGSMSMLFTYHLPSKLPYSEAPSVLKFKDDYIINPLYLEEINNDLLSHYDGDTLTYDFLGSVLGGSYKDPQLYKEDSLRIQQSILENMDKKIILSDPLGFAIPYSNYITDLPMETTLYAILDYQIPLLQLVLAGKVDYSTVSLNMTSERTVEYNFLKTIETGSNLKYTLSYDNSRELRETEFNYYFSTQYTNWIDRIELQVNQLDELGIHDGYLVGHERVGNNVFKVTYSNGLEILINYNLNQVDDVLGYDLPAMSYKVIGGE